MTDLMTEIKYTRKDFVSDQMVRWCPGCGDYAILAQLQRILADQNTLKEDVVFISGIGCSSRFPYYMNTYGIHSIHGRAPTLASGLKIANPDLQVWVITGDGDGLSIGGNHILHAVRRNIDINIILFNNRIYGLTKGQYSPTSLPGAKTKSSPMGSIEQSFNPLSVAIGAEATFVARTVDSNVKHMAKIFKRAAEHKGTSFVEIYQNCVIFNNGAWGYATDPKNRFDNVLELESGQPMIFGKDRDKGIRLDGLNPEVVSLNEIAKEDLLVHNEFMPEPSLAYMLSRMRHPQHPEPIGVFRCVEKPSYEEEVMGQVETAKMQKGRGRLSTLYRAAETWEVRSLSDEYMGVVFHDEKTSKPFAFAADTLAYLKSNKVVTASADISLAEAIDMLKEAKVGFMALVDEEGKVTGVFTEGDIIRKVACQVEDLSAEKVRDYMTSSPTTLKPSATVAYAMHLMALHKFRHLLLVDDDGKPEGCLSFEALAHYLEDEYAAKRNGK